MVVHGGEMAVLLNKSDMAASLGVSVQAFDKYGITPVERRGREVFYDVKSVVEYRVARELQKAREGQSGDGENDYEKKLLIARWKLTEEQAVSQKLKNQVTEGEMVDSGFCTFALSRLAMDLSSILDSIPLSMQRKFPDITPQQIEELKVLIAKGANQCARAGEKIPELMDEYIRTANE